MSSEHFARTMPKVELDLQLEGAIPRKTLLMIADQNEIAASTKGFKKVLESVNHPDMQKLADVMATVTSWLRHADDLSRISYEVGVALSKQHVRYAEVGLNLALYSHMGMTYDGLLEALNDGADRARRGWKVEMAWVLNVTRDEPRRADEVARWAMSAAGRKAKVVGVGLIGAENVQPAAQFERAFRNAEKKGLPRFVQAGDVLGSAGILEALAELKPNRLGFGWGIVTSGEALNALAEADATLNVGLTRSQRRGQVESLAEHPLRQFIDAGLRTALTTELPEWYGTTLSGEYEAAAQTFGLTHDEIEMLALNAVRGSFLDEDAQRAMEKELRAAYEALRAADAEALAADGE